MQPALRLHPGQQAITPAQEAEVARFASERIQAQLATSPVDESAAEALLKQAYAVAGLATPQHILWVDGPLQVVAALTSNNVSGGERIQANSWDHMWGIVRERVGASLWDSLGDSVWDFVREGVHRSRSEIHWRGAGDLWENWDGRDWGSIWNTPVISQWYAFQVDRWSRVRNSLGESVWKSVEARLRDNPLRRVAERIRTSLSESLRANLRTRAYPSHEGMGPVDWYSSRRERVGASLWDHAWQRVQDHAEAMMWPILWGSMWAYWDASLLACSRLCDVYLAPNDLHAPAHFNEMVSGYWLETAGAVIVRRPRILSLDTEGQLHSATGKCVEYRDGLGFYAWHGVSVPEKVILVPEQLTKADWSAAENVEVRRVIQERMGERFVRELGGVVIDTGPYGTLYEVALPDDPEQVARYVQVQDASTARQYVLRVPPRVQTAAEAVAWSFQVAVEEYGPAHET